jgi:hypothetical protein
LSVAAAAAAAAASPGLPDGIFLNQKFGQMLEGLAVEVVGIFTGHLAKFPATWYS